MSLALRLGKTLHELKQALTASELRMWLEYDRMSPVSDRRGDIQTAQVVTAIYNAQGGKASLDDVLLQWHGDVEEDTSKIEAFFGKLSD